jgi:hypothetical protein
LDGLKDPKNGLDQQSEKVANLNLASIINQQEQGDVAKAEIIARKSLHIMSQNYDQNRFNMGKYSGILAGILQSQNKLECETKELLERALAISTKHLGQDGSNTAAANCNLGFYYNHLSPLQQTALTRKQHLCPSISKYKEGVRILTKIHGIDNPLTMQYSSILYSLSCKLLED